MCWTHRCARPDTDGGRTRRARPRPAPTGRASGRGPAGVPEAVPPRRPHPTSRVRTRTCPDVPGRARSCPDELAPHHQADRSTDNADHDTPRATRRDVKRDDEQTEPAHRGPDRPGADGLGQHLPGDHRTAAAGPAAPGDHRAGPARRAGPAGPRPATSRRTLVVARTGAGRPEHRRLQLPALRRRLPAAGRRRRRDHVGAARVRGGPRRAVPRRARHVPARPRLPHGRRGRGAARPQGIGLPRRRRSPRRGRRGPVHGLGYHPDQAVGPPRGRRPAHLHRLATHRGRRGPAAVLAVRGGSSRRSHRRRGPRVRLPHHPRRGPELRRVVPGHRTPAGRRGLLPRTGQPDRGDAPGLPPQGPDAVRPPGRRHRRRLRGRHARPVPAGRAAAPGESPDRGPPRSPAPAATPPLPPPPPPPAPAPVPTPSANRAPRPTTSGETT